MYKISSDGASVLRADDGVLIPADDENADFIKYKDWLLSGGIPEAANKVDLKTVIQCTLDTLEQSTLMNRLSREFMLISMQDMAQRQSILLEGEGIFFTPQQILAANIGWQKLVALDAQASQLRIEVNNA